MRGEQDTCGTFNKFAELQSERGEAGTRHDAREKVTGLKDQARLGEPIAEFPVVAKSSGRSSKQNQGSERAVLVICEQIFISVAKGRRSPTKQNLNSTTLSIPSTPSLSPP